MLAKQNKRKERIECNKKNVQHICKKKLSNIKDITQLKKKKKKKTKLNN